MSTPSQITTLWSLIGMRVAHAHGGGGRIESAFEEAWFFAICWDEGVSDYTRVVPAEKLLIGGREIPEIVAADPNLARGVSSWKQFCFVSRCAQPQQFMQADRQRIDELFRVSQIDAADRKYDELCSFWWPHSEFEQTYGDARIRIVRDRHRKDVEQLLAALDVANAERYYRNHCADWYPMTDFIAQLDHAKAKVERLAELERERLRFQREQEELRRQSRVRAEVERLLVNRNFAEADIRYAECSGFWPKEAYLELKSLHVGKQQEEERRRHEEEVARERSKLREVVLELLRAGRFTKADVRYEAQCKNWWPRDDYEQKSAWYREADRWARAVAEGSLADVSRLFASAHSEELTAEEVGELVRGKVRFRLARFGISLDDDQMRACARPDRHRLIRARAGSGKTRTLAALAALTIHDEGLAPDQVLTLAFNSKAADEIGDRIREMAGISEYRNARTFHSLAHRLAGGALPELVFDDGALQPSRRRQSRFIEEVIHGILNPAFRERLYEFFRREIEQVERIGSHLQGQEYVAFRRAMTDFTLGGDSVKSNGEKFIADFLFEHDIPYVYERVYSWSDRIDGSVYRPDFCLSVGGRDLILEHWAIDPQDTEAEVPSWWGTTTADYRRQIKDKRRYWEQRSITLLETHAGMLQGGREAFESGLKALLEAAGVPCRKLDHETLILRVTQAPRTISRMAELFLGFISRAKKHGWNVEQVARTIADRPDPEPRNRVFHELSVRAYAEYEKALAAKPAIDFDDLLMAAISSVQEKGADARLRLDRTDSIAIRDLRWILLDEFQDFSELYHRLIAAVLVVNPEIRIIAVGDDWQAINGFAGAQLTFFERFGSHFQGGGLTSIATNYRSGQGIVRAGNMVMDGCGEHALAASSSEGEIQVRATNAVWVGNDEGDQACLDAAIDPVSGKTRYELARALKACVDFIQASVFEHDGRRWIPKVLVLSRTGHAYGTSLGDFGHRLRRALTQHPGFDGVANASLVQERRDRKVADGEDSLIEVMTVHKAKGKEADTVIILEATSRQFPKVHADNQGSLVFRVVDDPPMLRQPGA